MKEISLNKNKMALDAYQKQSQSPLIVKSLRLYRCLYNLKNRYQWHVKPLIRFN